ncbi:N-alpha-acetyltransferase 30A [Drosophila rhopaloa]|uniref:N-terminal methionine N(alpha)-acetyltransferase NatC n=1 Tax=Drosophila rhopaloa TaxID=1041015 RepID=A0A6P4EPF9_DRORH|nr:N-alpha-acetyltransferase 30A [Drosophila rhopaloa]
MFLFAGEDSHSYSHSSKRSSQCPVRPRRFTAFPKVQARMADAQAVAAGKKKYKNKKKAAEKNPSSSDQVEAPSNGHDQEEEAAHQEVAGQELRGLLKQLHLCNGHGPKEQTPPSSEVLNGHAHGHSNNNHIRSTSGSNNNNSSHNNNSVDSSNNNSKQGREGVEADALYPEEKKPIIATSKTTANTQTTTATATKTTASEEVVVEKQVQVATESGNSQVVEGEEEPLPSTSVEATPTITAEPQLPEPAISANEIVYKEYEAEHQMHDIMRLIQAELSEPYSIYTYRYFIYNWPKLCFLASHDNQYVGAIVCKLDMHMNVRRGYIAMLAVRKEYRKLKIGTTLVTKAIEAMLADNADEVVLETEMRNEPALRLYENLGFVRDKRLFRYYLNGVDALRLKLWFR